MDSHVDFKSGLTIFIGFFEVRQPWFNECGRNRVAVPGSTPGWQQDVFPDQLRFFLLFTRWPGQGSLIKASSLSWGPSRLHDRIFFHM